MAVSRIRRRPDAVDAGDPEARIAALMDAHGASLLRTARHFSLCADDAHDAMQRALEIYLRKLAEVDVATESSWLKVVVRHEAMAIRRLRSESVGGDDVDFDSRRDDDLRPVEDRLFGTERSARSAEALRRLKPDEARGLMLKAEGLSYAEIGERHGWTYTNVMATVAVFVALGGTSYAATKLARNSVGSAQIRSQAVSSSELKRNAVTSSKLRSRSVTATKLSTSARNSLRGAVGPTGPQGPAGPPGTVYRAAVDSGGGPVAGNTSGGPAGREGTGVYRVSFERSMAGCVFTATLVRVPGGGTVDPPAGRITAAEDGGKIVVRTFDVDATPRDLPFHVLAAC